jgi:alginate O-acetyltransferase complex protein AlgI
MLFDSPVFIVFLIVVVAAYWRMGWRSQNRFLLTASYVFYGWWDWRFLLLMAGSTTVDYIVARKLASTPEPRSRRALLIFSVALNFTFLGIFKYFNFFIDSFSSGLAMLGVHDVSLPLLRIILPPGISFYTFQEIAYIVDVYHGKLKPADSLVDYALFVSLFPHLIAGPIQRPSHLLPQVQKCREWDENRFFDGLMLILSGLFRKCVIADNCALLANAAFNGTLGTPNLPIVIIGSYAFAGQIYGDFSGYSDIARGCAQLLGFHFMVNFRQPYLATDLQQFWRRWHISLSTWLRDYLYIPLGGNAKGRRRTYANLLTTMLLGGLWHGPNWTFVVWGAIHGIWLAMERFWRELTGRAKAADVVPDLFYVVWIKRIALFQLVCLAWIFFRAPSLHEAFYFLSGITQWKWEPEYLVALKVLAIFTVPLMVIDLRLEQAEEEYPFQHRSPLFRAAVGMAALLLITFFTANQATAFIYFQF